MIPELAITLDAKVFPNPSLGIFNLNVESISVAKDVIPGMYLVEVRQGSQVMAYPLTLLCKQKDNQQNIFQIMFCIDCYENKSSQSQC
jgi:hypothetical protein